MFKTAGLKAPAASLSGTVFSRSISINKHCGSISRSLHLGKLPEQVTCTSPIQRTHIRNSLRGLPGAFHGISRDLSTCAPRDPDPFQGAYDEGSSYFSTIRVYLDDAEQALTLIEQGVFSTKACPSTLVCFLGCLFNPLDSWATLFSGRDETYFRSLPFMEVRRKAREMFGEGGYKTYMRVYQFEFHNLNTKAGPRTEPPAWWWNRMKHKGNVNATIVMVEGETCVKIGDFTVAVSEMRKFAALVRKLMELGEVRADKYKYK